MCYSIGSMKMQCSSFLIHVLLFSLIGSCAAVQAGGNSFLPHAGGRNGSSTRTVSVLEIESIVRAAVDEKYLDSDLSRKFAAIESKLASSYASLPKATGGGLAPRAVRHLVHSYFATQHGWLVNGLEPLGMRTDVSATMHQVDVLQDKAPMLVEALLEAQTTNQGLSIRSVAAMVVVLERLIYDESVALLEDVYHLSGLSTTMVLTESILKDVLLTYLAMFRRGPQVAETSARYLSLDSSAEKSAYVRDFLYEALAEPHLVDFQKSAVMTRDFSRRGFVNPFRPRSYSFDVVRRIVDDMAEEYGKWQDEDCKIMKAHLMRLDPTSSGRVPLHTFQTARVPYGQTYSFSESGERIAELGALEVPPSSKGRERVLIANYITSETNCLPASSYFSICCLDECEALMGHLESTIRAPAAEPAKILAIVSNLSSSTIDAPRQLRWELQNKLKAAAERHDGEVPLHGRLFRQWLHYAFPHECPLPMPAATPVAVSANVPVQAKSADPKASDDTYWSDEEVLPLHEDWAAPKSAAAFMSILRGVAFLAAAVAAVRAAASFMTSSSGLSNMLPSHSKDKSLHFA